MHVIDPQSFFNRFKRKKVQIVRLIKGTQFLHFLHIGKTGGTAIQHAMEPYATDGPFKITFHPHHIRLNDVPRGEKVFFFLRDPISRFISGFHSRQRQGLPKYFSPWSENEKIAFEEFSTPNDLALSLSSINIDKKRKAQWVMKQIYHVKDSYWNWFESEYYFNSRLSDIIFIGRQERLAEDFEILKQKIRLPDRAELPSDDTLAHRNPGHLDRSLENEAIDNLKQWYKADYEFLLLCKQLIQKNQ